MLACTVWAGFHETLASQSCRAPETSVSSVEWQGSSQTNTELEAPHQDGHSLAALHRPSPWGKSTLFGAWRWGVCPLPWASRPRLPLCLLLRLLRRRRLVALLPRNLSQVQLHVLHLKGRWQRVAARTPALSAEEGNGASTTCGCLNYGSKTQLSRAVPGPSQETVSSQWRQPEQAEACACKVRRQQPRRQLGERTQSTAAAVEQNAVEHRRRRVPQ